MTHPHDTSTPAMSAETVPSEEFVLVPREPTDEMKEAGARHNGDLYPISLYRAMLAAAPRTILSQHQAIYDEWLAKTLGAARAVSVLAVRIPGPTEGNECLVPFEALRQLDAALSASHLAKEGGEAGARGGIYTASKTKHAPIWKDYRSRGWPINSTWIDEAGPGESADLSDLWDRCIREASTAAVLVVYREDEDVLKGGWAEVGAALACGVPVYAVGIEGFTIAKDRRIKHFETLEDAMDAAVWLASHPQPSPALAKGGDAVRLLPCPFCGGEPTLHPHSPDHMLGAWVSCSTCGLESPTETGRSVEAAVQHWNTRAALSTPTEGPDEAAESGQAGVIKAAYFEGFADAQRALGSVDDMWDVSVAALKADDAEDVEAKYLAAPSIDLMQRIWANLYYNEADAGYSYQGTLNDVVDWLAERNALPPTEGLASQTEGMGGDALRVRPLPPVGEDAEQYRVSRGPEWCRIFDTLRDYRMSNMAWEDGEPGFPLVDVMSRVGDTVTIADGEFEMVALADEISAALTPPETAEAVPVAAEPNEDHPIFPKLENTARLREDLERVTRVNASMAEEIVSIGLARDAAEIRADDAVKALEPFAKLLANFLPETPDEKVAMQLVCVRDLRAARSASSQGGE